jgi:hypothetical protein
MKLKSATVEYGRVVNLGEYNSLRASCTLVAELEEGEDVDAALAGLWEKARENVREQVRRVVERGRPTDAGEGGRPDAEPG